MGATRTSTPGGQAPEPYQGRVSPMRAMQGRWTQAETPETRLQNIGNKLDKISGKVGSLSEREAALRGQPDSTPQPGSDQELAKISRVKERLLRKTERLKQKGSGIKEGLISDIDKRRSDIDAERARIQGLARWETPAPAPAPAQTTTQS